MGRLLILLTMLSVLVAGVSLRAGEQDILQRVAALQETARQANGGVLGCGAGRVTLVTSKGQVEANCGLDPIHVFGNRIKVADIHILLQARVDTNRSGKQGPMSGEVSDLCYVCLYTLALAKDPESIPVIVPLLQDKNETVRRWADEALRSIGNSDPALAQVIEGLKKKEGIQPADTRSGQ